MHFSYHVCSLYRALRAFDHKIEMEGITDPGELMAWTDTIRTHAQAVVNAFIEENKPNWECKVSYEQQMQGVRECADLAVRECLRKREEEEP